MDFAEWVESVPREITQDSLWKMQAYQLGLFIAEIGWHDVTRLVADKRTISLSDQLYRALGSVSANVAEGYSRGTGKDRARFYEYALGSARESRDWYFKARHILPCDVVTHRLALMASIIRLLLTMIPQQRARQLHEQEVSYHTSPAGIESDSRDDLNNDLLNNVPLP